MVHKWINRSKWFWAIREAATMSRPVVMDSRLFWLFCISSVIVCLRKSLGVYFVQLRLYSQIASPFYFSKNRFHDFLKLTVAWCKNSSTGMSQRFAILVYAIMLVFFACFFLWPAWQIIKGGFFDVNGELTLAFILRYSPAQFTSLLLRKKPGSVFRV